MCIRDRFKVMVPFVFFMVQVAVPVTPKTVKVACPVISLALVAELRASPGEKIIKR